MPGCMGSLCRRVTEAHGRSLVSTRNVSAFVFTLLSGTGPREGGFSTESAWAWERRQPIGQSPVPGSRRLRALALHGFHLCARS